MTFGRAFPWGVLICGALVFLTSVARLASVPSRFANVEMETALPVFVQVVLAGGDRYLASNIDVIRALTVSTANPSAATLAVQGRVQADGAWLNPANEDNYYLAAAILSWGNEVEAGNEVLSKAVAARPFDFVPSFFLGFNYYYFLHDPLAAARYMKLAAERADSEENRQSFEKIAARWTEKGSQPEEAIRILSAMQSTTRSFGVRQYLQERIVNLQQLIVLREAAVRFKARSGRSPATLSELVQAGVIRRLPDNPQGRTFVLDETGTPQLVNLVPAPRIRQ